MSIVLFLAASGFTFGPAYATTKGLNQIVTPDLQPVGQLSISLQQQDPTIANRNELQLELGLTPWLEAAVFQGTSPAEQILNIEAGYRKGFWLYSTGFLNWSTKGSQPEPFIETGYYRGNLLLDLGAEYATVEEPGVGGALLSSHQTQVVLGSAYHVSNRLLVQVDYQSGSGNFSTAGFTYNVTPALTFNPSLYISNVTPYKGYGYAVLTYTLTAWK